MRVNRIVRALVVALCRSSLLFLTSANDYDCCCQAQQQEQQHQEQQHQQTNSFGRNFDSSSEQQKPSPRRPFNVLLLMTDQQRYDALRRVQDELIRYDGKHKIRTPNLDRLAAQGAFMKTAYSPCPVCGPARTVLRTGCTIERTGVQTNILDDHTNQLNRKLFQDKIEQLESLDQILVEDYGYVSEYYGKWHIPDRLYQRRNGSALAVQFNDYDFSTQTPTFRTSNWETMLKAYLNYFQNRGDIIKDIMQEGQQIDTSSKYPYTPISLDSRFGKPTGTSTKNLSSFDASQDSQMGNLTLHKNYSSSFLNHHVALRALNRLASQDKPFLLTVSYHHPHPPYMAPFEYLAYYWEQRHNLYTSSNVDVPLDNSTSYYNAKEQRKLEASGYCDKNKIQEWTSVYYALVEEIDTLVGIMLSRLDTLGLTNTTLVVFTSDHGEMLGAHCLRGKNAFFEESARVPLMVKLPGTIAAGTIVDEPVSLMDVFSTILDYVGASASDHGDGTSLRPFIEGTSNNAIFDETAVISEWDYREPTSEVTLSRQLDDRANFMVRHGSFKLLIHKKADSKKPDVLYDLANDPFEMNNLIHSKGSPLKDAVIGKAEHLRYLLIDWMERMEISGRNNFYSDPIFNANEGLGDINEIRNRQSWPKSDIWVGDSSLIFRKRKLVRDEWLYIGRRSPGSLSISSVKVLGKDSFMFRLSAGSAEVASFGVFRLQVRLEYEIMPQGLLEPLDAYLEIIHNAGETIYIPLLVQNEVTNLPTPPPTGDSGNVTSANIPLLLQQEVTNPPSPPPTGDSGIVTSANIPFLLQHEVTNPPSPPSTGDSGNMTSANIPLLVKQEVTNPPTTPHTGDSGNVTSAKNPLQMKQEVTDPPTPPRTGDSGNVTWANIPLLVQQEVTDPPTPPRMGDSGNVTWANIPLLVQQEVTDPPTPPRMGDSGNVTWANIPLLVQQEVSDPPNSPPTGDSGNVTSANIPLLVQQEVTNPPSPTPMRDSGNVTSANIPLLVEQEVTNPPSPTPMRDSDNVTSANIPLLVQQEVTNLPTAPPTRNSTSSEKLEGPRQDWARNVTSGKQSSHCLEITSLFLPLLLLGISPWM